VPRERIAVYNMKNNNDIIELFEQRLCEYTGAPYAVAVDSCTHAIFLAIEVQAITKTLGIPHHTYVSVPMTLMRMGYDVEFQDNAWHGAYCIGNTNVWDYAVGLEENMYKPGQMQCLSFQQKKRLSIGKGGAILLDDSELAERLKRLRHDGRNSAIPVSQENLEDVIIGFHMNMTPDQAATGIIRLNQLDANYTNGSWEDYPRISELRCFK